jgi:hypothetical protein
MKMQRDPKYNVFHGGKWESIDQITSTYQETLKGAELGIPEVEIWMMHNERRGDVTLKLKFVGCYQSLEGGSLVRSAESARNEPSAH